jgi:hypothetical protein
LVTLGVPLSDEGGELLATVDFSNTKGFLGSSADPSQGGFANADKTLIAVNHQPVTKSSYVHLFLRSSDGDLTQIKAPVWGLGLSYLDEMSEQHHASRPLMVRDRCNSGYHFRGHLVLG